MDVHDLQTPTLLLHLDRVRENVRTMLRHVDGDARRWRPHVKTCKVPQVLDLLVGAGVRRFKVATTRELAVLLASAGTTRPVDVVVAFAHHGANRQRVVELAAAHPHHRIAMVSEDPQHAAGLAAAGIDVFVDVDPDWGRSGIPMGETQRILAVARAAGPRLRGLHCYEGHITDPDPAVRAQRAQPVHERVCQLACMLARPPELVTSGTPGFVAALRHEAYRSFDHAVSPGTVTYWDARSAGLGIEGFVPAVEVQARVISRPGPDRLTLDCGSKAVDAASGEPVVVVQGPWQLQPLRPSEEHLPVKVLGGDAPALGELVRVVPRHVCPTVNLADEAVLLDHGKLVAVVPVGARGHETLPSPATSHP